MSPIEVYAGEKKIGSLPGSGGEIKIETYNITYFGDKFGGYGVVDINGNPVDAGELLFAGEEKEILGVSLNKREAPPVEAGQPPTVIGSKLILKRVEK